MLLLLKETIKTIKHHITQNIKNIVQKSSLRASSPFGAVVRSHARAACER